MYFQAIEESTGGLLAYHSVTVPGLNPFQLPKKPGSTSHHAHLNLLSSLGRQQGTVRALSTEQMSRYRHLLPPRMMNPHHQIHEGTSATAVQRVASFSPFSQNTLSTLSPFPFRGTGNSNNDNRTSGSFLFCFVFYLFYF